MKFYCIIIIKTITLLVAIVTIIASTLHCLGRYVVTKLNRSLRSLFSWNKRDRNETL